jgi:uncharacterized membrane protein
MGRLGFALALLVGVTSISTDAQQGPPIQTTRLPAPQAGAEAFGNAINGRGVVAGTIVLDRNSATPRSQAFTWMPSGGYRVILENASASDINDRGQVLGFRRHCAYDEECDWHAYVWSPSTGAVDLGDDVVPSAINNNGTIVGEYRHVWPRRGFVRIGTTMRDLPGGLLPQDVNDRGVVAGFYYHPSVPIFRAAVWGSAFGLRDLDADSTSFGVAEAINNAGFAVGWRKHGTNNQDPIRAMTWTPFGGAGTPQTGTLANEITDRGWVVGEANRRPALWLVGRRLVALPIPSDATFGGALDANDAGQIVGYFATLHSRHTLIWTVR